MSDKIKKWIPFNCYPHFRLEYDTHILYHGENIIFAEKEYFINLPLLMERLKNLRSLFMSSSYETWKLRNPRIVYYRKQGKTWRPKTIHLWTVK